jgi:hypothetical protein
LLVWLSKRASHSDPVELETDLQTKNMVSASATTAIRRLWDADSYASNPEPKFSIQEKRTGWAVLSSLKNIALWTSKD